MTYRKDINKEIIDIEEAFARQKTEHGKRLMDVMKTSYAKKRKQELRTKTLFDKCKDPWYFRERYLSPRAGGKMLNLSWYRTADDVIMNNKFAMVLVPPGWGKSFGYTIGFTIQQICLDRTKKILLLSKSATRAMTFMQAIMDQLKHNPHIKRDFGEFFDKNLTWNTKAIKVSGSEGIEATFSISNQGFYSQIEGARPNIIIADDPLDYETARSRMGVEKFLNTMEITVIPRLEPGGQFILISHRFSPDDGLNILLNPDKTPRFSKGNALVIPALDADGRSTSPERWPNWNDVKGKNHPVPFSHIPWDFSETVDWLKTDKPPSIWQTSYMQRPIYSDSCPFKWDWIAPPDPDIDIFVNRNRLKWTNEEPKYLDLTIDPAYSTNENRDYTGMALLGPHPTDKHGIIIKGLWALWLGAGFANKYISIAKDWDVHKIYVEINNAKTLVDGIKARGWKDVVGVNATRGKEQRIGDLEKAFWSQPDTTMGKGQMRFYFHETCFSGSQWEYGWQKFRDEYESWVPDPDVKSPDHILDCLAQYIDECYRKKKPYSGILPRIGYSNSYPQRSRFR